MSTTLQTARPAPGTWRIGRSRVTVEIKLLIRDRQALVFTVLFPLILLVIFGSVFNADIAPGVTFAQYFLAGMIASGVLYTAFQNLAITIPTEREDGTLKRLRGTPMPPAAYFVGKTGMVLLAYVLQVALLMTVGLLFFHLNLPATALQWFTLLWVSLLGLACCTLLGLAFTALIKKARGASAIVSPVVLVLQFTSGVFFQYDQLPHWMQQFAALFPLKWIAQGMRSVFLPPFMAAQEPSHSWELQKTAIVLIVWTIAALILALRFFKWQRD